MVHQRLSAFGLSAVTISAFLLAPKTGSAQIIRPFGFNRSPFLFTPSTFGSPVSPLYGNFYGGYWGGYPGYYGNYYGGYSPYSWGYYGSYFPASAYTYSWSFYPASFSGSPANNPYRSASYYSPGRPSRLSGRRATQRRATIVVRVPTANAVLWVEGVKQAKKGKVRKFISPPLDGGRFVYKVKARWTKNGRKVTRTRNVVFRAGQRVRVNFGKKKKSAAPDTKPKTEKKKAMEDEDAKPDKKKKEADDEDDEEKTKPDKKKKKRDEDDDEAPPEKKKQKKSNNDNNE
jgi:uncharacterized protein (TIGR03000 family)